MPKKSLITFIVLVFLFAFTVGAFAVPIQLREAGVKSAVAVNATFPDLGSQYVWAGYYQLEIEGMGTFDGFCVDPAWSLLPSQHTT